MGKSAFCLAALAVLAAVVAEELYSDMFDHINPDDILPNDELRNQYYNCIMDTGPCVTDDQKYMKEHAAEAFATKCRKCTEVQKQNLEKVIGWYTENRPDEWTALMQKLMEDAKKMNISPV
ncbi:ejaculatory bulb-specific protein 3 [Harpegnathos saltator]|uniref:Ejaculatory bulb-specific protein 3 n=1 Tax=Harpegnathos saltator TaxID=610380 RepID=E2B6F7_HARSA|nr:ejaculatory bulb-specific protein 3 [Harpegnathos saltator]EFN88701.1 Ejaculatory bulb-specific protein 3 [Harpegnathos saltator]